MIRSTAQTAPGFQWTVASGTTDTPLAVAVDNQGHIRTVGYGSDLYFHTYDTNGQMLASAKCANRASFLDAAIDPAGNVYATGEFSSSGQFGNIQLSGSVNGSMFLAKYSPTGAALWAIGSTGGAGVTGWAVAVDPAGNAYVTGEFMGSSALQVRIGTIPLNNYSVGTMDAFLAKVDPSGKILWATRFGEGAVRRCLAIAVDKSGNAYPCAFPTVIGGQAQTVYKFSSAGSLVWTRSSKPPGSGPLGTATANAIAVDDQGNVCVTGMMCGTNTFGTTKLWTTPGLAYGYDYDLEITKYDSGGNVLWACKDGGTNIDGSAEITLDAAGNAFVLGSINKTTKIGGTSLTNTGSTAVSWYIAKCNPGGGFAWAIPTANFPGQNETPRGAMATAADGSVYFAGGGDPSSLSKLGIVAHPMITAQPTNQTIKANFTATLTVEATPAGTLSYQWYQGASGDTSNPVRVQSAISNILITPALAQTTPFWVRVSNAAGGADSVTATITIAVVIPPKITAQPQNSIIIKDQSATLSVTATGAEPLTYQWYGLNKANYWVPIDGSNSSTYNTGPLTNTSTFMVQVYNEAGMVQSDTVAVTVVAPLQITLQPQSATISKGQTVTLLVTATGGQAIIYQWFVGSSGDTNNPIPGAILNNYTTPPISTTTRYWVLLRTVGSTLASQTAVLTMPSSGSLGTVGFSGGKLNFQVSGAAGSQWMIQKSTDLSTWATEPSIGIITLDGGGTTNLHAQPDVSTSSFYRAMLLK